jgi:hypothetical protein
MGPAYRRIIAVAALALVINHCGASTIAGTPAEADASTPDVANPPDAGPGADVQVPALDDSGDVQIPELDDSGQCEGSAHGAGTPQETRPQATACGPSNWGPYGNMDAGALVCSTDADCPGDSGAALPLRCLGQRCVYDRCFSDSDCPSSQVCVCGRNNGFGLRVLTNVCVPANCHVDTDCGAGGSCSPSRGYCGSVDGYYCHTKDDTCVDSTSDCACGGNACVYAPTVGHFVCAQNTCSG